MILACLIESTAVSANDGAAVVGVHTVKHLAQTVQLLLLPPLTCT